MIAKPNPTTSATAKPAAVSTSVCHVCGAINSALLASDRRMLVGAGKSRSPPGMLPSTSLE
jgi:hypothetical protein